MKYPLLAASVLTVALGQFAQAMPVFSSDAETRPIFVRDGCGPGWHQGRDGDCHPDRPPPPQWRPWDHERRPPPPPPYYAPPPREEWRPHPRPCPPGYHVGRYSGVCRPNDD